MSEPKRPRELWGLWSDTGECWFYENFAFAFYRSQSKAAERRSKTLNPDFWRVVPVPDRLDAPPIQSLDLSPITLAKAILREAKYFVLSPEEVKERTGH